MTMLNFGLPPGYNNPVTEALQRINQPANPMAGFHTPSPMTMPASVAPEMAAPLAAGAAAPEGGLFSGMQNWMQDSGFLGRTENGITTPGWGGLALGGLQGLGNAYLGMQQYGLAKKSLAESTRRYNQDYAAQRGTVNTALEDRQRARVAANPGAYQSVSDYMNQHGVK